MYTITLLKKYFILISVILFFLGCTNKKKLNNYIKNEVNKRANNT